MGEIKRSYKARLATTRSMTAQYRILETIVKNKTKEVAKVKSYEKYNLSGYTDMLNRTEVGLANATRDLTYIHTSIQKAYDEGKILSIRGITATK